MKHWWELRRAPLTDNPRIARIGGYLVDGVCVIGLLAFGAQLIAKPDAWFTSDHPTPIRRVFALLGIAVILGRWVFQGVRPSASLAEELEKSAEKDEEQEKLDETWQFRKP